MIFNANQFVLFEDSNVCNVQSEVPSEVFGFVVFLEAAHMSLVKPQVERGTRVIR